MATTLVEGMAETWGTRKYRDTWRNDVLAMVQKKVKEQQIHIITEAGENGTRLDSTRKCAVG